MQWHDRALHYFFPSKYGIQNENKNKTAVFFMEDLFLISQVNRLVDKNHLFKCSIILIKAWCYYESCILGAHHGLISTYALEVLVLYVFHLFHSSLNGPISVSTLY